MTKLFKKNISNILKDSFFKFIFITSIVGNFSPTLRAAESPSELKFRGNVEVVNNHVYVQDELTASRFSLIVSDSENQKTFSKLKTGDMISGSGHYQNKSTIAVESIAFIGLAKLVGYWAHNTKLFNFLSFSALNVWTMDGGPVPTSEIYKYVLTPIQGNGWRIFVGGEPDGVNVGSLEIKENQVHIVLHDPKTHKIIVDYILDKIE